MASVIIDRRQMANGDFSFRYTVRVNKNGAIIPRESRTFSKKKSREEVRISLDKVDDEPKEIEQGVAISSTSKLSTSKLAKKNKLKTADFLDLLTLKGYLSFIDETHALTSIVIALGGETKQSKRFSDYLGGQTV
jgi:hypothetical protein